MFSRKKKNVAFRTMLVEDNSSFRRVVKFYLESLFPSMLVIEAANGTEALKEIDSLPPDLIFMNFKLPGEDGLELTRKIKAHYSDIIIIIFTSYDFSQFREVTTQYKADYYFSKGAIATGEIAALVKSILLEKGFRTDGSTEAFGLMKGEEISPLIRKRRIWWEAVPDASSYVVYVGKHRTIFEPRHFLWETTPGVISKLVIGKTELIIPDDWPEFPREPGVYYIGITSKDDFGNQSDPFVISGLFKFLSPPAPSKGGIECLNPSPSTEMAFHSV